MKKLLCAILALTLMAGGVCAADTLKVGELSKLNITQEDFQKVMLGIPTAKFQEFRKSYAPDGRSYRFYDSLMTMLMGLNRGEVDEINLPKDVANYVVRNNDAYEISAITVTNPNYLSAGFKDDEKGQELKSVFNDAIITLDNNGGLASMNLTYIYEPRVGEPDPVIFEKFDGAETIKVAVTGDLPTIDFIAEDGDPAGFNTAVLSEIAKLAKLNVELVNIDSSARAAALVSGRVDAVFWFQVRAGDESHFDVPDGIILSQPYYTWDEVYSVRLKAK